jgi:hypothetical protein
MAAASRTVSTSGSLVTALVEEPAWSIGAMGEDVGWLFERWPAFGVDGHGCSRARGAVAGGGRSALPSGVAGVGPYLDPAPRCGVSSQVGGLIARLLAPQAKGDRSGATRGQAPGFDEVLTLQPGSLLLIWDRSITGSSSIPQRRQLHHGSGACRVEWCGPRPTRDQTTDLAVGGSKLRPLAGSLHTSATPCDPETYALPVRHTGAMIRTCGWSSAGEGEGAHFPEEDLVATGI